MDPHRQRLDQRALHGAHIVRKLEAEARVMGHILLEHPVHRRGGEKDHIRTEIIAAGAAEFAVPTGLPRLQGHPVPHLQAGDSGAHLHHCAARLMPQHKGGLYLAVPDPAGGIVVEIRAADAHILQFHQYLVRLGLGDVPFHKRALPHVGHDRYLHLTLHGRPPPLLGYFNKVPN